MDPSIHEVLEYQASCIVLEQFPSQWPKPSWPIRDKALNQRDLD